MARKFILVETQAGEPVKIQQSNELPVTLFTYSQALTLHFSFLTWVWNRPLAVEVRDGEEYTRLPIQDITRIVQIGSLGLNLLFLGIALFHSISRRKVQDADRK